MLDHPGQRWVMCESNFKLPYFPQDSDWDRVATLGGCRDERLRLLVCSKSVTDREVLIYWYAVNTWSYTGLTRGIVNCRRKPKTTPKTITTKQKHRARARAHDHTHTHTHARAHARRRHPQKHRERGEGGLSTRRYDVHAENVRAREKKEGKKEKKKKVEERRK